MELTAEGVLTAMRRAKGYIHVEDGQEVASLIAGLLGVKHLKPSDADILRAILYKMAAMGHLELFFDSDAFDADIVAVITDVESKVVLRGQVAAADSARIEAEAALQHAVDAQAVAEELLEEADKAHRATLRQLDRLQQESLQPHEPAPASAEPVIRPTVKLPPQSVLTGLRNRAKTAEDRVGALLAEASDLRRRLRLAHRGYAMHNLTCGCVVARVDGKGCKAAPGGNHPWFPLVIPGVTSVAQGQALIASWMMGQGPAALLLGSDVRGKPLRP